VVRKEHPHRLRLAALRSGRRTLRVRGGRREGRGTVCWELLFPRQWGQLKRVGAQIVFHLNNAIEPEDAFWEHLLLTRAFENRYFVASVNNAAAPQTLPSYLIAPTGETLLRSEPQVEQALSRDVDLSQVQPTWS
jgi:predicted amidohydrolase